jgi:hypothetical protein
VRALHLTNRVQVLLVSAALLCAFGPHLVMLGFKVAGGQAPGALSFFCLLQHGNGASKPAAAPGGWTIQPSGNSR